MTTHVLVLPRAPPPDFAEAAVTHAALVLAPADPARPEGEWEASKDTIGVGRPLADLT